MMYGYGGGVGLGLGGWLGLVGGLVLLIAVVLLVAWLIGRVVPARDSQALRQPAGQDAVELLRLRFARGEITADEYRAARQVLEDRP
jgi:putative membrane protein